jgi:hypothetical protein
MPKLALGDTSASPATPASSAPHVVRVVIAGTDKDANALTGSLAELLSRLGARLEIARVERVDFFGSLSIKTPGTFATAWVDLTDPQRAAVVLVEGSSGRIVARRSAVRVAHSDVATEELAHIIQASVEDMVAEVAPPPPPPSASSSAPPTPSASIAPPATSASSSASGAAAGAASAPAPASTTQITVQRPARDAAENTSTAGYGVGVGAFFVGRSFGGDSSLVVGGGGAGTLRLGRSRLHPTLSLSGAYHVPFEGSGSLVKVRASALALRFSGVAEYEITPKLSVSLGPALGADVFFVSPQAVSVPSERVNGGSTDVSPMLGGVLGARYAVTRGAEMFVMGGFDVDLRPHRYVVHDEQRVSEVPFEPSRVRPYLALGFDFTVAGRTLGEEAAR